MPSLSACSQHTAAKPRPECAAHLAMACNFSAQQCAKSHRRVGRRAKRCPGLPSRRHMPRGQPLFVTKPPSLCSLNQLGWDPNGVGSTKPPWVRRTFAKKSTPVELIGEQGGCRVARGENKITDLHARSFTGLQTRGRLLLLGLDRVRTADYPALSPERGTEGVGCAIEISRGGLSPAVLTREYT